MPILNDAADVRLGTVQAVKVYAGVNQVWPPQAGDSLSASLVKVDGQAQVTVSTQYGGTVPTTYKYYLSENGGAWVFKYEGGPGPHTFNTSYSTQCRMKVESYENGTLLVEALTNTVTTDAEPPPTTQQKVVTLSPVEWYSYNGFGSEKSGGYSYGYSGYFSSNHGNQKCSFRYSVPSDVRWCVSVDKVEMSAWNLHAYGSTRQVQLALHHYGDLTATTVGSTSTFSQQTGGKPGWVGGQEWIDITNYTCPGRYQVWDEFRRHGANGLTMNQGPTNSQSYYGYVRSDVRLRITYTVYT